jgi:hypothetical protein
MLAFSIAGFVVLYAILRLQAFLHSIRRAFANAAPDLAFNTAVSFVTNTNWQVLWRRDHDEPFQPDGRADRAELSSLPRRASRWRWR